jgi:hypothetical protein
MHISLAVENMHHSIVILEPVRRPRDPIIELALKMLTANVKTPQLLKYEIIRHSCIIHRFPGTLYFRPEPDRDVGRWDAVVHFKSGRCFGYAKHPVSKGKDL